MRESLVGRTFGRLKVVEHLGRTPGRHRTWLCQCTCGKRTVVATKELTAGHTKSCGCLGAEMAAARRLRHGRVMFLRNNYPDE